MRPRHDWVHIEIEPLKEKTGIILTGPEPVRVARAIAVGPGRTTKKGKLIPCQVKVGDRFPFFKAVTETGQGRKIAERLPEGQAAIRESDILFLFEDGADYEVTV